MGAARKTAKRHTNAEDAAPTTVGADRVAHVRVDPEYVGQRLDNFLIRLAKGVPKSHVYRIVRSGEVRVNRGRVAADYRLQAGVDQVVLVAVDRRSSTITMTSSSSTSQPGSRRTAAAACSTG